MLPCFVLSCDKQKKDARESLACYVIDALHTYRSAKHSC